MHLWHLLIKRISVLALYSCVGCTNKQSTVIAKQQGKIKGKQGYEVRRMEGNNMIPRPSPESAIAVAGGVLLSNNNKNNK